MHISFYKYQGTGNDFVILDNRKGQNSKLSTSEIKNICDRRFGIGADGLMLLNEKNGYDFEMKYYNADGRESSMCGNGGRCMVKFAHNMGIRKPSYQFIAVDGLHDAEIDLNGWVRLKMVDVHDVERRYDEFILNTGSPHLVKMTSNVKNIDVRKDGAEIRNRKEFAPNGVNVNFVENINDHTIFVRTFERGVEDETLSCGTGVVASALMAAHNENGFNQVDVQTLGGKLNVEFDISDEDHYTNIWLCGPADFVFSGEMEVE
ncbi:MAG: diaminopimelate epimerase [Bacteroidetes bacterium]|nr:MAG: diaminopimelate epimerase [Bacteroidota bacterium]